MLAVVVIGLIILLVPPVKTEKTCNELNAAGFSYRTAGSKGSDGALMYVTRSVAVFESSGACRAVATAKCLGYVRSSRLHCMHAPIAAATR